MTVKAGEILQSSDGRYYRVIETNQFCVSLMPVGGQTIIACKPEYVDLNFSVPAVEAA